MKKKNTVTVDIECSNKYAIPVFDDFLNELQKRFNAEKDAKNEAYSFILQMGLLEQFEKFSQNYKGIDHHAASVDLLSIEL